MCSSCACFLSFFLPLRRALRARGGRGGPGARSAGQKNSVLGGFFFLFLLAVFRAGLFGLGGARAFLFPLPLPLLLSLGQACQSECSRTLALTVIFGHRTLKAPHPVRSAQLTRVPIR
jgi:hypothetical protein